MNSINNISVLGAGSMGCATAQHLAENGYKVKVWSPVKEEVEMLVEYKEHKTRLPGVPLSDNISYTNDFNEAGEFGDMFVLAVPAQTTRQNSKALEQFAKGKLVVTCSKGIEDKSCKLLTEIMEEEMPEARIVVLSGPSHAEEIARNVPTTVVAASKCLKDAEIIQDVFMSQNFRVYTNDDVIGVELGGAIKNVIALCAGISDGLGYGDNTKAALMTRGITELARLGVAMGGKSETFYGLTGIGDLIVTCTSMHSRNRRAGILVGQGKPVQEALDEVKMIVEGYATCKPTYELSKKLNVSMPIIDEAYKILFEGKDVKEAVNDLMAREKKPEFY